MYVQCVQVCWGEMVVGRGGGRGGVGGGGAPSLHHTDPPLILPGSRKQAALHNFWLFKMSTRSPTVQLVVPQSDSSSCVALFPCSTRPSNLLTHKHSDNTLKLVTHRISSTSALIYNIQTYFNGHLPDVMLRIPVVPVRLPYEDDHIFPPVLRVQVIGQLTADAVAQFTDICTGSDRSSHHVMKT